MRTIPLLPLLALVGCTRSNPPDTFNAEVRILGVNPGAFRSALVAVKDLTVTDGVNRLAVRPGHAHMNLTPANAWLAGTVAIPKGVDRIHVVLQLDDFGGWESDGGAGDIDARSAPIVFDATVEQLRPHGMATVRIDVNSSLVAWRSDTRALLPKLDVVY